MRSTFVTAAMIVTAAVMIGCKQKPKSDDAQPTDPESASTNVGGSGPDSESGGTGNRDEVLPPWPPLPEVPPRPAQYPNTASGRIARVTDDAADQLLTYRPPANENVSDWAKSAFRKAFAGAGPELAKYPKAPQGKDKEWFAPVGDATKSREPLDKAFTRFSAAWTCFREMHRRWEIEKNVVFLRRVMRNPKPKELRDEATRGCEPGQDVRIDSGNLAQPPGAKYDVYRIDAKSNGDVRLNLTLKGAGRVSGRVAFGKTFTLTTGPMAVVLTGSVGEELILEPFGPAVVDLSEFSAPMVRIRSGEDVLIRVGPGVKRLEIAARYGLVLARGAPDLKVQFRSEPERVAAFVAY